MKTLKVVSLLVVSGIILSSCSNTKNLTSYDDVYFDESEVVSEVVVIEKTKVIVQEKTIVQQEQVVENESNGYDQYYDTEDSEYYQDENGDTYITNNYYDNVDVYDDYDYYDYDYAYTKRIRRFHRPYVSFSYYDPFFYDPYWYNPYYGGWNSSFYWNYGYGYAHYDPFYYGSYYHNYGYYNHHHHHP
ncbi:MAG: hypothetical protein HOA61_10410, partial [Bacteroidetes bacterium]|nr:hypothetical protein [Bacteroidota bacterium]